MHTNISSHTSRPVKLTLASSSPARHATLAAARIAHDVKVSYVDEQALLTEARNRALREGHALSAGEQVALLAEAKACAVARDMAKEYSQAHSTIAPSHLVLGCDSMFSIDGAVLGKPHSPDVARKRLHAMSGNSGILYTGHFLIDTASGYKMSGVSSAVVHIAHLSEHDIEAYIASGEPLEVAGSFTIDGRGGPFIERIEGDYHGVVGLSLPLLRE